MYRGASLSAPPFLTLLHCSQPQRSHQWLRFSFASNHFNSIANIFQPQNRNFVVPLKNSSRTHTHTRICRLWLFTGFVFLSFRLPKLILNRVQQEDSLNIKSGAFSTWMRTMSSSRKEAASNRCYSYHWNFNMFDIAATLRVRVYVLRTRKLCSCVHVMCVCFFKSLVILSIWALFHASMVARFVFNVNKSGENPDEIVTKLVDRCVVKLQGTWIQHFINYMRTYSNIYSGLFFLGHRIRLLN